MDILRYNEVYKINKNIFEFKKVRKEQYYNYANINSFLVLEFENKLFNFILNIDSYFITGNSLDEFESVLESLSFNICDCDDNHIKKFIPVYVDDLTYYYYYLRKHFDLDYIFSVKGNVAYFRIFNIEFRCIGVLSDLEFETEFSTDYVLKQKKYLEGFTKINDRYNYSNLPVTQIKFVKNDLLNYKRTAYYELLNIQSVEEYHLLRQIWSGGICSYNPKYLNKVVKRVQSFDFKSAYPSIMCKYGLFPVKFLEFKLLLYCDEYINEIKEHCVIGHVLLKNVRRKKNHPGIKKNLVYRYAENYEGNINLVFDINTDELVSASVVKLYLTEVDYLTIKNLYDFELVGCTDCYIYERGMLPRALRNCVLHYFDVKEKKDKNTVQYIISKKAVNSIFGLNYIDPNKAYKSIDEISDIFIKTPDKGIHETILDYNINQEKGNNYTSFQWGIYICGIQRLELSKFICKAIELDLWIYSDTDSLYLKVNNKIKEFIKFVKDWNYEHFEYMNKTILKRKKCKLGLLLKDEYYSKFKVLAKKQYFYEYENGEIGVTMSGINKKKASAILNELNKTNDVFELVGHGFVLRNIRKTYVETEYGVEIKYTDITLGEEDE